jgi:hypothetical protein
MPWLCVASDRHSDKSRSSIKAAVEAGYMRNPGTCGPVHDRRHVAPPVGRRTDMTTGPTHRRRRMKQLWSTSSTPHTSSMRTTTRSDSRPPCRAPPPSRRARRSRSRRPAHARPGSTSTPRLGRRTPSRVPARCHWCSRRRAESPQAENTAGEFEQTVMQGRRVSRSESGRPPNAERDRKAEEGVDAERVGSPLLGRSRELGEE